MEFWMALIAAGAFGSSAFAQTQTESADAPSVKTKHVCGVAPEAGFAACHAQVVVDEAGLPLAAVAPSGYGPADLRDAYKITSSGSSAHTIAIVDAFHYRQAEAHLKKYRTKFGLPPCTKLNGCFSQVDQRGGSNFSRGDLGWNQEAALDLDMASAMCPNCKLVLVEGDSNTFVDLAAAVDTAASLPNVIAVSNSYGGSESGTGLLEAAYDHLGIAVTASTGDSGFGVAFPSTSPHVTAVGGTRLVRSSNARGWAETAWSGAGSGCSHIYAKPTWQTDTTCARRTVADVSAVSDPSTGVAVYGPTGFGAGWLVFGGTSVAAPLIAGIYAVSGNAVTYGSDPYGHTGSLFDITSGSNGSCGGSYLCTAVPGFDGPTGLGTPNGLGAF